MTIEMTFALPFRPSSWLLFLQAWRGIEYCQGQQVQKSAICPLQSSDGTRPAVTRGCVERDCEKRRPRVLGHVPVQDGCGS